MKKSYLSLSACALLATFTFVGCGSSSSTPSSSTGTLQLNPYLANIDYTCGTTKGVTNSLGEYSYKDGESCTFVIGGKSLSATPSSNLTIESIASQNSDVSAEVLSAYIIAKMSKKSGKDYDINNLPEVFELPEDIKGDSSNSLDFSSFDKLKEKISDSTIISKVENIKFDVAKRFAKKVVLSFEEIATPTTNEAKNTQQASTKAFVNGEEQAISYNEIMKTGMSGNGQILGQSKDYQDNPITFGDGSAYICNGTNDGEGSGMDFTSLHNVDGKIFAISQFECALGSMYMVELNQDTTTGKLTSKPETITYISQKDEFGGFVHCAGQKTPWNSHLSSEEYEPNAKAPSGNSYYDELAKYWKDKPYSAYYYGWTPEVKIENSQGVYSKHYSMGRFSHELAYVMPDNKTVYLSDDGTNVGLFMFVADEEKDLSAGTLYAAKWNQTSQDGVGAGSANLTWINLGHSTNTQIRTILDKDNDITTNDAPLFTDIFDSVSPTSGVCDSGYTSINTSAGQECLRLKTTSSHIALDTAQKIELAASRLETRRYAALKGATTEFNKEEGITFDKNSGKLYVAISDASKGMENNSSSDLGGNNDIRIAKNSCGVVYALDLSTTAVNDTTSTAINSNYVVKNMYGVVEGNPLSYGSGSIYAGNSCDVNGISNPDNVAFLENSDVLIIGEDTSKHLNNVVWAYNTKTEELTRTFTTPLGAETTSPFWYANLANNFSYLGVVTQHPNISTTDGGESAFGYVGPFKDLTKLEDNGDSITSIKRVATYSTSTEGGSEIVAFDKETNKIFVTNGASNAIDVFYLTYKASSKTTTMTKIDAFDLSSYGSGVQSVAVKNGKVAVAVGSSNKVTTKGKVLVFDVNGELLSQTIVGYLPDMVTFNEDGTKVIVANEGEPDASSGTYVDVVGSIGVVTLNKADILANANGYSEVTFENATLSSATDGTQVRLGGTPSNDKSLDIEPEYITVSGNYAYVTLQENNAIAKVDISGETPTLQLVKSLGAKDYSTSNTIDIEEEGEVLMKNYKGLYGLYMPDSIASYKIGSKTYLVTANEGDGREYLDSSDEVVFADEAKISKLDLVETIASDYADENDLKVLKDMGKNSNNEYEKIYTLGARSFSIWDENGSLVFDSGDEISKLTSKIMPKLFNQDNGEKDGRSGNKGVEPEALALGKIGGKTYAFVGLERQNAIVVYDISTPEKSKFVKYIITEDEGDISPEGMKFVSKEDSPTGNPLLMVSYEISGSTSVYEIK